MRTLNKQYDVHELSLVPRSALICMKVRDLSSSPTISQWWKLLRFRCLFSLSRHFEWPEYSGSMQKFAPGFWRNSSWTRAPFCYWRYSQPLRKCCRIKEMLTADDSRIPGVLEYLDAISPVVSFLSPPLSTPSSQLNLEIDGRVKIGRIVADLQDANKEFSMIEQHSFLKVIISMLDWIPGVRGCNLQ